MVISSKCVPVIYTTTGMNFFMLRVYQLTFLIFNCSLVWPDICNNKDSLWDEICSQSRHIVHIPIRRLRQDWESASRELGKLKDRHLEQAVKYSRALEEQGKASTRERDLLRQVGGLET